MKIVNPKRAYEENGKIYLIADMDLLGLKIKDGIFEFVKKNDDLYMTSISGIVFNTFQKQEIKNPKAIDKESKRIIYDLLAKNKTKGEKNGERNV